MSEILISLLLAVPIAAIAVTFKFRQWAKKLNSRFMWGIFWVSLVTDIAAIPIALIAARRLYLGISAPVIPGTGELLTAAILALESTFIILWWKWRDLDKD